MTGAAMPSELMWVGVARKALPCALKPLWVFQPVFEIPTEGTIPVDTSVALYDCSPFDVNNPADWPWVPALEGFVLGIHASNWVALKQHLRRMRCFTDDDGQLCAWPWFNPAYWNALFSVSPVNLSPESLLGPIQKLILANAQGCKEIQPSPDSRKFPGHSQETLFHALADLSAQHHADRLWAWCLRVQHKAPGAFARQDLEAWVLRCSASGTPSPYRQAIDLVCALWCGANPLFETGDWLNEALDSGFPEAHLRELHSEFSSQSDSRKPWVRQQRESDYAGLIQAQAMSLFAHDLPENPSEVFVPCGNHAELQTLDAVFAAQSNHSSGKLGYSFEAGVLSERGRTWSVFHKGQLASLVLQQARQWPVPPSLQTLADPVIDRLTVSAGSANQQGQTFLLFDARQTCLSIFFTEKGPSAQLSDCEHSFHWQTQNHSCPRAAETPLPHGFVLNCEWAGSPPNPLRGQLSLTWQWRRSASAGLQFHMHLSGEVQLAESCLRGSIVGQLDGHAFDIAIEPLGSHTWVLDEAVCNSVGAPGVGEVLMTATREWAVTGVLQAVQPVGEHRLALAEPVLGQLQLACVVQRYPPSGLIRPRFSLTLAPLNAKLIASHPLLGTRHVALPCTQATTLAQWEVGHG